MTTFKRICIKDFIITDQLTGKTFQLKRGKEYTTSNVKDGNITVFSSMWCHNIPVDLFAGEIIYTKD